MRNHPAYLDAFETRPAEQLPIGELDVGSKAVILSLHFKRALIVKVTDKASNGLHVHGVVLYPKGSAPKGRQQEFDRYANVSALPITDKQADEYIQVAEEEARLRRESEAKQDEAHKTSGS